MADKGLALPYVQLRQTVQGAARERSGPVDVTYRRGGTLVEVPDASAGPALAGSLPWPLGKLFYFRPVELSGPRACTT